VGQSPRIYKVLTVLGEGNDAEENYTKETAGILQKWTLFKISAPLIAYC
jgi:hypothetical protein